jgi:hypothetical protein
MPEWIPYETSDEPALEVAIDVDLDGDAAFRAAHPYLITISISGFSIDAGGQPDDTAAEGLFGLEQRAESVCAANGATPVCTVSGDGFYRIFAYATSSDVEAPLRAALAGTGMTVDVRTGRDDAWATYEEYALRGDDLENARDADLIMQMQEAGDDLSLDYVVTFEWSLADPSRLREAVQALRAGGYDVTEASESDDIVAVQETMQLTEENLERARKAIGGVLASFGAVYEGWDPDPDDEGNDA